MGSNDLAPQTLAASGLTLRDALAAGVAQLATNEQLRSSSRRDAELLLLDVLQLPRAALLAHPDRKLTADEQASYDRSIARRMQCEPIQYITGEQEFYGLLLTVSPAVLIPRPETEHVVETLLQLLPPDRPLTIADVGTGSGAIAIALAVHLPQARIVALDLSEAALAVAAANAARHGVADRIHLLHSDLLTEVNQGLPQKRQQAGCFDAVVSNPPYIPEPDRPTLHAQVRDFEPGSALFAGSDGLDVYRRLIPQARHMLRPEGLLVLEIGDGQRGAITDLLSGWREVRFVSDLQGIARAAVARRPDGGSKKD